MFYFRNLTISIFLFSTTSEAATYPRPEISSIMFHVDKLPLDQDRMKKVTRDLITLASKNANGNQKQLNNSAKFLAIAIRLDSKNKDVQRLNMSFSKGENIAEPDNARYQRALADTNHLIRILSKAEKFTEAQIFADYLKDAVTRVAGSDPAFKDHQINKQRWQNVVPEIVVKPERQLSPKTTETEPKKTEPKPNIIEEQPVADLNLKPQQDLAVKWNFLTSTIATPVILSEKINDHTHHYWDIAGFDLTWKALDEINSSIRVTMIPEYKEWKVRKLESRLQDILASHWKDFPSAEVTVRLPATYSSKSGDLGVLPIVTQLYASLKNTSVPAGVQMIGSVKSNGEIYGGNFFWSQLKELRSEESFENTLFCPLSAEKGFKQLIALEEAQFFVKNEVISVNTIDDVTKYFGDVSDPNLKSASEKFVKIRNMIGSRSVGAFSVNKELRAVLEEIVTLNPNHISAKMILLRGDPKRSLTLDSYFVAEEFKSLMNSLKWINERQYEMFGSSDLSKRADEIDEQLKSVARYIDSDDIVIATALEDMADELNILTKSLKKSRSSYQSRSGRVAHDRFKKHFEIAQNFIKEKQQVK